MNKLYERCGLSLPVTKIRTLPYRNDCSITFHSLSGKMNNVYTHKCMESSSVLFLVTCHVVYLIYSEWMVNQHRDSFASYIGHPNLLEFFSIAENESKARVKFNFLQVLHTTPCLFTYYSTTSNKALT